MIRITDMRSDQAESSGWLFKSPLAGGWGILCRPQYRSHNLLLATVGGQRDGFDCAFPIFYFTCSFVVQVNSLSLSLSLSVPNELQVCLRILEVNADGRSSAGTETS